MKTQFDTLLEYFLTGGCLSQTEAYKLGIAGSSFGRLVRQIEKKYDITLIRHKRGEGQKQYFSYEMKLVDRCYIKIYMIQFEE